MCKPKPEQLAVDQGELPRVLLYLPSLRRIQRENAICQAALVLRYPRVWPMRSVDLCYVPPFPWARSYPRRSQGLLGQGPMTPRRFLRRLTYLKNLVVCHKRSRRLQSFLDNCPLPIPLARTGELGQQVSSSILLSGTCTTSNETKEPFNSCTYSK